MTLNHHEYKIMNVIWNYNNQKVSCTLLKFQLISIHSRTGVYEADVISASLGSDYLFWCSRVSTTRSIATIQWKPTRNYNVDNLNFAKFCPCFGFADVRQILAVLKM